MEVVLESFKCEVIVVGVGFEPNLSSERLIVVWLSAHPFKYRGVLCCALPLVRDCIVGERSCVLSNCIYPNPQWRFPVWEVLCGRYSGNSSV